MAKLETHKREARRIVALARALNKKLSKVSRNKTPEILEALAARDAFVLLMCTSVMAETVGNFAGRKPASKKHGLKFRED